MLQRYPVPNPEEVATLLVGGRQFTDWETVWVQHRYADDCPLFKFTCAERAAPELIQFKPGDPCAIYLGGQIGVVGVIVTRQVAYDANSHGVLLFGKGVSWWAARSSVMHETHDFSGKDFETVAKEVIAPFGVGVRTIGSIDKTPFQTLHAEPGRKVWDFLEGIARPRGVVLGSDPLGNILLIGDHVNSPVQDLIEGENILKCQAVFTHEQVYTDYIVTGQHGANDQKSGTDTSEMEAGAKGTARRYSAIVHPAEQPVWDIGEVAKRAQNEAIWSEGTIVQVTATVQGWLRGGGQLWAAGDVVHIKSPMCPLNDNLKAQTVTFTQDSESGTLTTLELVAPWLLRDKVNYNVDMPAAGKETGAAATPAAGEVPEQPKQTLVQQLKMY
jgi:prophage tail gpP-like protein